MITALILIALAGLLVLGLALIAVGVDRYRSARRDSGPPASHARPAPSHDGPPPRADVAHTREVSR